MKMIDKLLVWIERKIHNRLEKRGAYLDRNPLWGLKKVYNTIVGSFESRGNYKVIISEQQIPILKNTGLYKAIYRYE